MQFSREESTRNLIRAWEPGRIRIGERWLTGNLIVSAETIVSDWTLRDRGRITVEDLMPALELGPEVVIVGAGLAAVSPDFDLMRELAELAVGLEYMQTQAACRTYNVLVHEGRRVAAALIQQRDSV
ncbi:MAG TPA: MTH938/NDUFAF3 family protein [Gammaproteobacteria bacterium]|nr:MTH938/NDUFAF3 family protein [Gammaproteobacteria bacterium]